MTATAASTDLLDRVRADLVHAPGPVDVPRIARVLAEAGVVVGAATMLELTETVRDHVEGLGPLQQVRVEREGQPVEPRQHDHGSSLRVIAADPWPLLVFSAVTPGPVGGPGVTSGWTSA